MASATEAIYSWVFLFLPLTLMLELLVLSTSTGDPTPTPTAWPHQFHSVLFVNRSGSLWQTDLWYDWPNGRNFNINQYQLGILKYDLEWNNGTSFIYTPFNRTCTVVHYDVGIPLPNWLDGANYLGQHYADNFLCNVWEKVDFIWYYEDVLTRRPVKWIFYDGNLVLVTGKPNLVSVSAGMTSHFMTFDVGAVLDDAHWQAPSYCFGEADDTHNKRSSPSLDLEESRGTLMSEMARLHAYAK